MKMNSKQIACKRVNRLLLERHITKSELADGINVDRSNLGKMLNGQHPFDLNLLDPIADFFEVHSEELLAQPQMIRASKENTVVLIVQTQKIITNKIIEQILAIL